MLTRDDFFEAKKRFVLNNDMQEPNLILFPVQELESFKNSDMWTGAAKELMSLQPGDEIHLLFGCRCIITKGGGLQFAYAEPPEDVTDDGETRSDPARTDQARGRQGRRRKDWIPRRARGQCHQADE